MQPPLWFPRIVLQTVVDAVMIAWETLELPSHAVAPVLVDSTGYCAKAYHIFHTYLHYLHVSSSKGGVTLSKTHCPEFVGLVQ